jgi:hypothetical protein
VLCAIALVAFPHLVEHAEDTRRSSEFAQLAVEGRPRDRHRVDVGVERNALLLQYISTPENDIRKLQLSAFALRDSDRGII